MTYRTKHHPLVAFFKAYRLAIRAVQWKRIKFSSEQYTGRIVHVGRAY